MFWFSTKADFSITFFNNIEMVLSGEGEPDPKDKVKITVIQRDEQDNPNLVWQGELTLKNYLNVIDFINRLPKGFQPISMLADHFTRLNKFQ